MYVLVTCLPQLAIVFVQTYHAYSFKFTVEKLYLTILNLSKLMVADFIVRC